MATIVSIAQKVGLTPTAVSYALRGKSGISEETRARILRVATEMGYRPNTAARAIRQGRFDTIGLICASRLSEAVINPSAIWAIQDEMLKRNLRLLMSPMPDEHLTSAGLVPQLLQTLSVDGLLISYTHREPRQLEKLVHRHHIPAIWMNTRHETDCVFPDDLAAGRMATEHLLKLGHRHIAYCCLAESEAFQHYSLTDRRGGYEQAMLGAGLQPQILPLSKVSEDEQLRYLVELLKRKDRPTAFVAYADTEASVVLYAAATAQVKVPEDVSLVAIVDELKSINAKRVCSTLVGHAAMGRRAIDLLAQRIENGPGQMPAIPILPVFYSGETAAAR